MFPVLPIKQLVNQDGELTTPHKLENCTKSSVSNPRFFSCVVLKENAHVDKKALNMRHRSQKVIRDISVGIPKHLKGHLIYIPST